jgi:hypothetical protein
MASTNWIQHHKLASNSSITEPGLWARLTDHGQMASNHGRRRKERGRGRRTHSPYAQAHVWMAWRGSARAAGQRLPGEDFITGPPGAPHSALPPACTHTPWPPRRCTPCAREKPARCPARWRQRCENPSGIQPQISSKRRRQSNWFGGGGRGCREDCFAQGGGSGVHWRRPESPGDGEAIRVSPEQSSGERGREKWAGRVGWVGLTDPDLGLVGLVG